jgi:hypothetical protein
VKLIKPKFAVTTCLLVFLTVPAVVFADGRGDDDHYRGRDRGGDKDKRHRYAVPEPSTLLMTLTGMGIGNGFVVRKFRRNRRRTIAA